MRVEKVVNDTTKRILEIWLPNNNNNQTTMTLLEMKKKHTLLLQLFVLFHQNVKSLIKKITFPLVSFMRDGWCL